MWELLIEREQSWDQFISILLELKLDIFWRLFANVRSMNLSCYSVDGLMDSFDQFSLSIWVGFVERLIEFAAIYGMGFHGSFKFHPSFNLLLHLHHKLRTRLKVRLSLCSLIQNLLWNKWASENFTRRSSITFLFLFLVAVWRRVLRVLRLDWSLFVVSNHLSKYQDGLHGILSLLFCFGKLFKSLLFL